MSDSYSNARLDTLLRQYAPAGNQGRAAFMQWVWTPAMMFAVLGILFAINFGVSLIAIAAAILYYYRFGYRIAAGMAGLLLAMLTVWMMIMPAHHLVAASLAIFACALAGQVFGGAASGQARTGLGGYRRHMLAGPVYAMVMFRERLIKNPGL